MGASPVVRCKSPVRKPASDVPEPMITDPDSPEEVEAVMMDIAPLVELVDPPDWMVTEPPSAGPEVKADPPMRANKPPRVSPLPAARTVEPPVPADRPPRIVTEAPRLPVEAPGIAVIPPLVSASPVKMSTLSLIHI